MYDAKSFIKKVDTYLSDKPELLQRFLKMIMLVKKYDADIKSMKSMRAFVLARDIVKADLQILKELEEVRFRAWGGKEGGGAPGEETMKTPNTTRKH